MIFIENFKDNLMDFSKINIKDSNRDREIHLNIGLPSDIYLKNISKVGFD